MFFLDFNLDDDEHTSNKIRAVKNPIISVQFILIAFETVFNFNAKNNFNTTIRFFSTILKIKHLTIFPPH